MRRVFVDTSYLLAGFVPEDSHHSTAKLLRDRLGSVPLVTTQHVRGETWTIVQRRENHRAAVAVLDGLAASQVTVARTSADDEDEALRWLRHHDEREYSFVDATSFAFMRRNRITEALAFDGDFAAAGFVELRPG